MEDAGVRERDGARGFEDVRGASRLSVDAWSATLAALGAPAPTARAGVCSPGLTRSCAERHTRHSAIVGNKAA